MIYPVMPKRQPKVDLNRRKFQESQPPSNSCLPNLTISVERSVQKQTNEGLQVENGSTGCKLKGEEIKNKIRYLMLREKVSPDTEDEYCSSARESKGVNIKEWFSIFSSIASLIIKWKKRNLESFFNFSSKALTYLSYQFISAILKRDNWQPSPFLTTNRTQSLSYPLILTTTVSSPNPTPTPIS